MTAQKMKFSINGFFTAEASNSFFKSYKQLQMRMIKKYLKKDIYLQKKDKKLLTILILI